MAAAADQDFRADFEPAQWGPHAWHFLHTVTHSYPHKPHPELQQQMRHFFELLQIALPCAKCRTHFAENFKALEGEDDPFRSKTALTRWLVELHNRVNQAHGKPTMTSKQAEAIYASTKRLCGPQQPPSPPKWRMPLRSYILALVLVAAVAGIVVFQSCRTC